MRRQLRTFGLVLIGVIAVLILFNTFMIISIKSQVTDLLAEQSELARPAEISLMTIVDSACEDCFDVGTVVDAVKGANVDIVSENSFEYTSAEAQALIDQYGITKVPTVIVTGETAKEGSEILGLEDVGEALILTDVDPVYLDLDTGEYRGRITVVHIQNTDCTDCYDMTTFVNALEQVMVVSSYEVVDMADASQYITDYSLQVLPALIIGGDLGLYPDAVAGLEALGYYKNEHLVLTAETNPPYWDLNASVVRGLVNLTYLVDESCETCYNYQIHETVLRNYRVAIGDKQTVDISTDEGQALLAQYNITKVPTVLLSPDAQYYPALGEVWAQVGTVEDDGTYVFRELDVLTEDYVTLEEA